MSDLTALLGGSGGRTRDFEFVYGEYAISGERVPYFSTSMTIAEALTHLRLAQSLAIDPGQPVRVEELIQRDVSDTRAQTEIASYLKQPGRLKFFNSLTVVLMPVEDGRPVFAFGENVPADPPTTAEGLSMTRVGPVTIGRLGSTAFGRISWRTDSVAPVIIDGQHRFVAMRHVNDSHPQLLESETTRIPVLILVLDERAGFVASDGAPKDIVPASRSIFTDINKNAIKVSPEREYLLDDTSLNAVCMRGILTSGVGQSSIDGIAVDDARIPLALVDWSRQQTRFDEGPFLSTIQALHQLVGEVISAPAPDATDYAGLSGWLDRLESRLGLLTDRDWVGRNVRERLARAEESELPFGLSADDVDVAARRFREDLGQVIVRMILRAAPYRHLVGSYFDSGFLGGRKELWLGQNRQGRDSYVIQFNEDPTDQVAAVYRPVKAEYELAYLVVFQRAFVLAAREIRAAANQLHASWNLASDNSERAISSAVLDHWISRFNSVLANRLADPTFWAGTAVKPGGGIDFGQRARAAVTGLTLLACLPVDTSSQEAEVRADDGVILSSNELGHELDGLLADPLLFDSPTDAQKKAAADWRALLAEIAPGPKPGGEIRSLRRYAARVYRNGLRRYVELVADTNGQTLSVEQRDRLVMALGARRLAALREG